MRTGSCLCNSQLCSVSGSILLVGSLASRIVGCSMFSTCRMWPCDRDCCMVYTLFKHSWPWHTLVVDLPPLMGNNHAELGMVHGRACRCAHQLFWKADAATAWEPIRPHASNRSACRRGTTLSWPRSCSSSASSSLVSAANTRSRLHGHSVEGSVACEGQFLLLYAAMCDAVVLAQLTGLA